jgi:hypothetical protein
MARQGINTGTSPNDGLGDSLLVGAIKINSNFSEIYSAFGNGNTLSPITGYANTSGIATYAIISGYSTSSGVSTTANYATIAGYSTSSGVSTTANYATTSGVSTSVIGGIGSIAQLQVTGVSTFTNGPVLIGSASSTGTASQALQVNSGAYISGSVGVGTTNPGSGIKLDVVGGEIKAGRVDSTNEGGQVSFGRATDNATAWYLDVYGSTSTPQLRFVDVSNAAVRAGIDSLGYFTGSISTNSVGLYQAQQYYRLDSNVVGLNTTAVQKILGVGVVLASNTVYEFEGFYIFTKTAGAGTHNFGFSFGGTATINNISVTYTTDVFTGVIPDTTSSGYVGVQTGTANLDVIPAISGAGRVIPALVKGSVSVNSGGTFIPQYKTSSAPGGAYSTSAGSYFKIAPLSTSGSNTSIGNWT